MRLEPERSLIWADVRGLPDVAERLARCVEQCGAREVRVGAASVAVAAELAARGEDDGCVTRVEPGRERAWLAPRPLALLGAPDARLLATLESVGVVTCGQLAALAREAVEVRFGAAGAALWRLARADDPRVLFAPLPRERPHASLDWVDYVVQDPERLAFTANALLDTVCRELRARGEAARRLELRFALADGRTEVRRIGTARPTARRDLWLRQIRLLLEGLALPDAVSGLCIRADDAAPAAARQGDLFDRGFATQRVREDTLIRLLDDQGEVVQAPRCSAHPLPERRTGWAPRSLAEMMRPPRAPEEAAGG